MSAAVGENSTPLLGTDSSVSAGSAGSAGSIGDPVRKTSEAAAKIVDSSGQAIWTCTDFDWALRNPLPGICS
ncbi:MAG: hypothetical protein P0S95_05250 [Rhabdochlamydiaceae bacterium]|nr:hypothetical protein [Candidatus Amphrikana amoebophyrae]